VVATVRVRDYRNIRRRTLARRGRRRERAGVGPALPRPHHAGLVAGEELRGLVLVTVVPQMKMMAVVMAIAVVRAAMTTTMHAAMPAPGGRVAHDRE
jgi:hypothetical protein